MFDQSERSTGGGSAEPREADVPPPGEGADAAELPLERLEHEIVQLASHVNAGMCRWLELVAEFDRREGWGAWNCRSCAEWVAWQCALDPRSAREHVRVARRLEELPRIRAEFRRGVLSYSKVRALTRVADADSEGDLLQLAEHATAAQLDRIVRGMRRMDTEDAQEALAARFFSSWWEADGSLSFSGNLPAEEGAALLHALDAMHDLLRKVPAEPASEADSCGSAEPPGRPLGDQGGRQEPFEPRTATNADALCAMADAALAAAPERRGGERCELVVHVDAATLANDAPGTARIEDGSALAPETVRRLACDCSIVPLVEAADGSALSVGRRTRSVPPAIGRALRARDVTCAFPGCESRRFLDAHHIHHWAQGGETSADNLVLLCRRHHRLLHEGRFSVERVDAERGRGPEAGSRATVFRDPRGVAVAESARAPAGNLSGLGARPASRPHPGTGERLDLDLTLWILGARKRDEPART